MGRQLDEGTDLGRLSLFSPIKKEAAYGRTDGWLGRLAWLTQVVPGFTMNRPLLRRTSDVKDERLDSGDVPK